MTYEYYRLPPGSHAVYGEKILQDGTAVHLNAEPVNINSLLDEAHDESRREMLCTVEDILRKEFFFAPHEPPGGFKSDLNRCPDCFCTVQTEHSHEAPLFADLLSRIRSLRSIPTDKESDAN